MTNPLPLMDAGNPLLGGSPIIWKTGTIPTADGEAGVFVICTVDVSLHLGVTREQLDDFIAGLTALRDSLPRAGSGLVTASVLPPLQRP